MSRDDVEAEIAMLRAHLAALAPALERAQAAEAASRAEAERIAAEAAASAATARDAIATADAAAAEARDAAASAAESLAALRDSTTWRLTAPLRSGVARLRRRRAAPPAPREAAPQAPQQPEATPPAAVAAPPEAADPPWYDPDRPDVSIIVLNFDNAALTRACIASIHACTTEVRYEILLADNGSCAAQRAALTAIPGPFRLLEIGANRRFGEGNNIAAEHACAPLLCLLNNDTEVTQGWLGALVRTLREDPRCGAVGAKLVFPDGRLQEAGALVLPDGHVRRLGLGGDAGDPRHAVPREVHYASAACLLLRRDTFLAQGGFDLLYEPGYYEDADLCLRLRAEAQVVRYCPDAVVRHHQGASHRTVAGLTETVAINRAKFVARWQAGAPLPRPTPPRARPRAPGARHILLHLPEPLIPGAGLRALLQLAVLLARRHEVVLVPQALCSRLRLDRLGALLGLDLSAVSLRTGPADAAGEHADLVVTMGDTLIPPETGPAAHRLHICRFPTPIGLLDAAQRARLAACDGLVVPSAFVRRHVEAAARAADLVLPPVSVMPPALQRPARRAPHQDRAVLNIMALGSFRIRPRYNLQDALIRAFAAVQPRAGRPIVLHLAGATHPDSASQMQVEECRRLAAGLPVQFHLGLEDAALAPLLASADLVWHGTGFQVDPCEMPWLLEPCGAALLEAMAQGALPFARDAGAPAELIVDGLTGHLCADPDALAARSLAAIQAWDEAGTVAMRHRAAAAARRHTPEAFAARWLGLTDALLGREAALAS